MLIACPAQADEQAEELLEEVVVIGNYLEDGLFQADSQVSIDHHALEAIMPAETEQLLQRMPGVSVFRPGGPGGVSEVFLRGAESNFTAVFVDGVRLNNPANTRGGSFDFSSLSVSEIGRVDIAMGAMSAIYGSDAMAGVIRIETAWPEAGSGMAWAEAGTHSDWRMGAATVFEAGDVTTLGLRASTVDGGDEIEGSSLDLTSLSARLAGRRESGDGWQVNLRHVDRGRTSFSEVSGGPDWAVLPDLEVANGEELSLSATTGWTVMPNWRAEIIASWADLEDDIDTPPVPPGVLDGQPAFTTASDYRRAQFLWVNRLTTGDRSKLAFGVDFVDESGRDDGIVDLGVAILANDYRLERTTASGFLEVGNKWRAGFSSSLAVRLDHFEDDSRVSGKFGVAKTFEDGKGRLWANAANGFKLPGFFALGNPLFGNPDLAPEKVTSLEVGFDWQIDDRVKAGISLFSSEYENLVDFDFERFVHINRRAVDISGLFLHARFEMARFLWVGVDATVTNVSSDSGPLRRRPENIGGLDLTWRPGHAWSANAAVRYVGERLITSIPTGDVIDDAYFIADATVSYEHSDRLVVWIAIDNLFDTDFQDAPGLPSPGTRMRLGAQVRF